MAMITKVVKSKALLVVGEKIYYFEYYKESIIAVQSMDSRSLMKLKVLLKMLIAGC